MSHAGAAVLVELADRVGLTAALFGAPVLETTTHRVLKSVDEQLLGQIRAARAKALGRGTSRAPGRRRSR